MCMCRKSEGPSELIGSKGDKGGRLQKKNPGGMFAHKKGEEGKLREVWEVEKEKSGLAFRFLKIYPRMLPS